LSVISRSFPCRHGRERKRSLCRRHARGPETPIAHCFHAVPHPAKVDAEDAFEFLVARVEHRRAVTVHTRIVERGIEPPKRGDCLRDHFDNLRRDCDIAGHGEDMVPRLTQFVRRPISDLSVAVGQDHGCADLGKGFSSGEADTTGRSRHQSDLSFENSSHLPPPSPSQTVIILDNEIASHRRQMWTKLGAFR
jgi:hypothetical protein